jgi:pimeloyl-ACP methyl ester carboxylesterase
VTTIRRVPVDIGELAATERGPGDAPTVVLVHGYPDTSRLWDPVAVDLAADHHVVTYDVRGAGASAAPAGRAGYRLRHLLDDLAAVVEATTDGGPVHLVGHDWGAIQGFAALTDDVVGGRLASFTALSAPGIEVARWWLRAQVEDRSLTSVGQVARQVASSWYIAAFQLPALPEWLVRRSVEPLLRAGGHPAPSPTVVEDAVRGLELYRANRSDEPLRAPMGRLPDHLPVRVLTGRRDRYVTPRVFDDLRDRLGVPVTEVEAGHWLPLEVPALVADHVRATVAGADRRRPPQRPDTER